MFPNLTSSAEDNIRILIDSPVRFHDLRRTIGGEKWVQLSTQLAKSLLEFDKDSQETIIQDFTQNAHKYGLEYVTNPDPNYKKA